MDRLQQIAEEFHLSVIEDAAQAIGARWANESGKSCRAGSMGVAAAFSFYPTKNLSAYGDAGHGDDEQPEMAAVTCVACAITAARAVISRRVGMELPTRCDAGRHLRVKLKYVEGWNMRGDSVQQLTISYLPRPDSRSVKSRGENSPIQLPRTPRGSPRFPSVRRACLSPRRTT